MKVSHSATLDELICVYLERADEGHAPDPSEFISAWPHYRNAFFEFLERSEQIGQWTGDQAGPEGSASESPEAASFVKPILGGYRIKGQIGRGGMSRVFEAERIEDRTSVALKVLDPGIIADRSVERRFRREARAIQSVQHPHIVPIFHFGSDQGISYLVLQLIRGCTLADLIDARGRDTKTKATDSTFNSFTEGVPASILQHWDFRRLAEKVAEIADALHAAHQQGIVHRDVKPSNLILDHSGHTWLTDFGLASAGEAETALTQSGQVVGTPCYMSPEQARGDVSDIGSHSDIYSLGATLYELATLRRPYDGDRIRVLLELSAGRLKQPSKVCPGIPEQLEAIILKAMAFLPADRYSSAAEMAADLRRYAVGQKTVAKLPRTTDRLLTWIAANPRKTISAAAGLVFAGLIIVCFQHLLGRRLYGLNQKLEGRNQLIESANEQLVQSNRDLDRSRSRLRRHLYVADLAAAYRAYAQRDTDAVQQLLDRHQPFADGNTDQLDSDRRGFEWWLLHNLVQPPPKKILGRHAMKACELALIPNSQDLLSVGHDGAIRRWPRDERLQSKKFHVGDKLDAIAVSSKGDQMLVGQNVEDGINPVTLRCTKSGQTLRVLQGHDYSVESAAISPSGRWLATAGRYHEVLLHSATGQLQARLQTGSRNESLGFSADEKFLYAVERQQNSGKHLHFIARCEVPSLTVVDRLPLGLCPKVFCLSKDGRRLLAANQDALVVVDPEGGEMLLGQTEVRGRIRCVAITDDGNGLAAGCDNGLLHVWDQPVFDPSETAEPSYVINTGPDGVTSLAFDGNHDLFATLKDGAVHHWSLGSHDSRLIDFESPIVPVDGPATDPGSLFGRRSDGSVYRIDLAERGSELFCEPPLSGTGSAAVQAIAVSDSGQQVLAASKDQIVAIDPRDRTVHFRVPSPEDHAFCSSLQFLPGDDEFLALYHNRLFAFDAEDGRIRRQAGLADEGAERLCISPMGNSLLVASREWLRCFDSNSFALLNEQASQFSEHTMAKYSPSGRWILLGHQDGTLELLDGLDLTRRKVLRGHRSGIDDCVFLPGEQTLITIATSGGLRFWDVDSGREVGVLRLDNPATGYRLHFDKRLQSLFIFNPKNPVQVLNGQPR